MNKETREYTEGQVIGGFLNSKNLELISQLQQDDFQICGNLFRTVKGLYQSGELFRTSGTPDMKKIADGSGENVAVVGRLMTDAQTFAHAQYISDLLHERIITICGKLARKEITEAEAVKQINAAKISELHPLRSMGEYLVLGYPEELERRNKNKPLYLGLQNVDNHMKGIAPGELLIMAGRPGSGKSTLALQCAANIAESGHKVIYITLEMPKEQIADRLIQRFTTLDRKKLRFGDMDENDYDTVNVSADFAAMQNLFVDDKTRTLSQIRELIKSERPEAIFIDQLSLLQPEEKRSSLREHYILFTHTLKSLAMQYSVPIVLLCQLRRTAENTFPALSMLKESGSIEEDADNVILLHCYENAETAIEDFPDFKNERHYIEETIKGKYYAVYLAKMRNESPAVKPLIFNGVKYRFEELTGAE